MQSKALTEDASTGPQASGAFLRLVFSGNWGSPGSGRRERSRKNRAELDQTQIRTATAVCVRSGKPLQALSVHSFFARWDNTVFLAG